VRIIDYFDKGVALDPDRPMAVDDELALSFAEGQELSWGIARGLFAAGFEAGDGAAVLAPNHPLTFATMLGIWRAGAAWIPLNPMNPVEASVGFVTYTEPRWLFFHSTFAAEAEQLAAASPSIQRTICIDSELEDFIAEGDGTEVPDLSDPFGAPDVIASLSPTGGTTGSAKAVMVRNRHIAAMFEAAIFSWPQADDAVNLMVAPITHAAGGIALILASQGATTVMQNGFNPVAVMEAIQEHRVTHMFLPPTAYYALLDVAAAGDYDTSSMRMLLLAASPVAPEKFAQGVEVFGPCVCQCYGQVESPLMISWLDSETVAAAAAGDHPERLASAGRPPIFVQVGIMDDEGNLVASDERGEIVVRGRLVVSEYLNLPEETERVREFGWHHTGDIGYLDSDGYLYIVDRKKDMIITGGFNVYSAEVEAAILAIPGVLDCAVIGVPDEKWGEMVTAVIVTAGNGDDPTEDEVIARTKRELGSVQAPKRVHIAEALPKTGAGKVDKKAIRGEYWKDQERQVG